MADTVIGRGVLTVGFDPKQVEQAGNEQLLPSAKRLAGNMALAFAGVKLLQFGKQGLDELKQAEVANAQLAAVIQSTGNAAGISAEHIDDLSQRALKLSGVDDEAAKKADTLLLQLGKFANTDLGHQNFDRAATAANNLSIRMGTDMPAAAQALAVVLQAPEKGMGRLRRTVGDLSAEQQKSIDQFVAQGDTAGAQAVILDKLDQAVGGAAAAYGDTLAGKVQIAQESMKNMKAELVAGAAPALALTADAVTFMTEKFDELPQGAQTAIGSVVLIGGAVGALSRPVADLARVYETWMARSAAKVAATSVEVAANEALAVSEAGVAAGESAVATNSAASVAGLYAESTAADAATVSTGAFMAVATGGVVAVAGLAYGLNQLGDAVFGENDDIERLTTDLKTVGDAMSSLKDDAANFTQGGFTKNLADLVRNNGDYAKAFKDAGITTAEFADAMLHGGDAAQRMGEKIANSKNLTQDDKIALGALTDEVNKQAQAALDAAVANGQLDGSARAAAEGANHFKDGTVDFIGVLEDLASKGLISKQAIDDVKAAAEQDIETKQQEALATWYATIAENANKAEAAALKLAPADIRVQRGKLNIEDDKQAIIDAEAKVKWLKESGASAQDVAEAERDLAGKRLDLEQATLDQAEAEKELATQRAEAAGAPLTQQQQDDIYLNSLQSYTNELNGPVKDALSQYIWLETVAANAARDRAILQNILSGNAPSLHIPGGGSESGPRPTGGNPGPRAAGGPVTGPFIGAEQGFEILLNEGMYQAPPGGGYVLNHSDSMRFLAGTGNGVHIDQVVVQGDSAPEALRRLPDELRAAAFLAGV